jgi:hypothetical protein
MGYEWRLWRFIADMNGDGFVTITDVWMWLKWLYFYPGDGLLYLVEKVLPGVANFFEVSALTYGGGFSGIFSFFVWLILYVEATDLPKITHKQFP